MKFKLGDTDIPFVFRGDELMYPNYVKDGLVLHYDFSGMTNADTSRGIATDLSGNGNHGTLQNFNFTPESGYDKNKLSFDGVDDWVEVTNNLSLNSFSLSMALDYRLGFTGSQNQTLFFATPRHSLSGYSLVVQGYRIRYWIDNLDASTGVNVTNFNIPSGKQSIVITCDGDSIKAYRNGVLTNTSELEATIELNYLYMGRYTGIGGSDSFREGSSMSDIKVYNRPLTPEEIAHNYSIEKERFGIE